MSIIQQEVLSANQQYAASFDKDDGRCHRREALPF